VAEYHSITTARSLAGLLVLLGLLLGCTPAQIASGVIHGVIRPAIDAAIADEEYSAQHPTTAYWLQVENKLNCAVWNENPEANETASWSGSCSDGKASGVGTLTFKFRKNRKKTQSVYTGELLHGKLNGFGTYDFENRETYEGTWGNGELTKGTIRYRNGDQYIGEISNYKSQGQGTLTFRNGDIYFGRFEAGTPHGDGTYTYLSGDKLASRFWNGKPSGRGIWTLEKNDGQISHVYPNGEGYVGNLKNGKQNGLGTLKYADGSIYSGDFDDGVPQGVGTFTFTDGTVYIGNFWRGKPHGQGTEDLADGGKYAGQYENGLRHGRGVRTYADGKTVEGIFEYGSLKTEHLAVTKGVEKTKPANLEDEVGRVRIAKLEQVKKQKAEERRQRDLVRKREVADAHEREMAPIPRKNRRSFAVIIGNKNYKGRVPSVDFAHNDADAFRGFVIDVLGYDPENIIDLRDASKAQLETAFGNRETHEGKLWRYISPKGKSDVVVFYSGHGVPGLKDKRGYILPVDADAETPEINGYPVDTLLANLGKLKTKAMTVYLDACFSGDSQGGRLVRSTSGITISPKLPNSSSSMTIITAAQGDQVASWDLKAKHGMFTKHLLDALRGEADKAEYGNGDMKISLGEVMEYLEDRLTRSARREFGRHQNAWARGDNSAVLATVVPGQQVSSVVTTPKQKVVKPIPAKPNIVALPKKYNPGVTFKDCGDCPEMVVLPRGAFLMGDLNDAGDSDERPVHRVNIAYDLAVGKYEVTQAEWRAVMGSNPSEFKGDRHPVDQVSWDDAKAYLKKLNARLGLSDRSDHYRLPLEAEWEYAARAGTNTIYHWGDSFGYKRANCQGCGSQWGGNSTAPVGRFGANDWGLHDLHGNVWEWVEDCWNSSYAISQSNKHINSVDNCRTRVLRGGSLSDEPEYVRAANRFGTDAAVRSLNYGFRIARTLLR
jgi:formylglycine-generating enzyme required for sulfatase activity